MAKLSKALMDFRNSLKMADALRIRENAFNEIPKLKDVNFVYGLRGGSIVLMVGAFENFLEELIVEKLDYLNKHQNYDPKKLPTDLIFYNCSLTFQQSIKKTGDYPNNIDKIGIYQKNAALISNNEIEPQSFIILADNNPKPDKVKKLFYCVGIQDIFKNIKPKFDKKWDKVDPGTWIEISQELETLIDRRHEVAHAAYVRGFSRKDLKDISIFFKYYQLY
jgi:hypothetical protein